MDLRLLSEYVSQGGRYKVALMEFLKQRGAFVLTVCGAQRYHCGSDLFGVQYDVRSVLMCELQRIRCIVLQIYSLCVPQK